MSKTITLTRKRIAIEGTVDPADVVAFVHIAAAVDNTDKILETPAPASFTDADRKARYDAALESNNDGRGLLTEWWNAAKKKYNVPNSARFDSSIPEFYELVDEDGVAYEGELVRTPAEEGESITYEISGRIGVIAGDNCDGSCCGCKN